MSKSITLILLAVLTCLSFSVTSQAQSKPRWVIKGTKSLDAQRSNDTYSFVMLNTHDPSLTKLQNERVEALKKYIDETYHPEPFSIEATTYSTDPLIYSLTYKGTDGQDYKVIAKLVDEYDEFDDFELNVFQFEFYQLFAVSKPNVIPIYDDFSTTKKYAFAAKSLGFIPGMSQLYKGQNSKGYLFIAGEALFVGATLYFDWQRRDCNKMREKEPFFEGSWKSKAKAWRTFEYSALGCAAVVYIYNLIDAFTSEGAKQVIVKKNPAAASYTLAPYMSPTDMGLSFVLNF